MNEYLTELRRFDYDYLPDCNKKLKFTRVYYFTNKLTWTQTWIRRIIECDVRCWGQMIFPAIEIAFDTCICMIAIQPQ